MRIYLMKFLWQWASCEDISDAKDADLYKMAYVIW